MECLRRSLLLTTFCKSPYGTSASGNGRIYVRNRPRLRSLMRGACCTTFARAPSHFVFASSHFPIVKLPYTRPLACRRFSFLSHSSTTLLAALTSFPLQLSSDMRSRFQFNLCSRDLSISQLHEIDPCTASRSQFSLFSSHSGSQLQISWTARHYLRVLTLAG